MRRFSCGDLVAGPPQRNDYPAESSCRVTVMLLGGLLLAWFRRARRGFVPQPRGLLNLRARRARVRSSRSLFSLDERLDAGAALVVGELHRRRLHQVGRRRDDRATEAAVLG